jgi:hypothetical protein
MADIEMSFDAGNHWIKLLQIENRRAFATINNPLMRWGCQRIIFIIKCLELR